MRLLRLLLCLAVLTSTAHGQSALTGVIDIHAHSNPDVRRRKPGAGFEGESALAAFFEALRKPALGWLKPGARVS
jgi:hypothetical protein